MTANQCLQAGGGANQALLKFNPNIVNSNDNNFQDYPLQLSGARQGMAIRVDDWAPNHDFIAFFANGEMRGRIEGKNNFLFSTVNSEGSGIIESSPDFDSNEAQGDAGGPDSTQSAVNDVNNSLNEELPPTMTLAAANEANAEEIIELIILAIDFIGSVISAVSSFTSIPFDPVDIFEGALGAIISGADLGIFIGFGIANVGVAYESGSGDYAEWLEKENVEEVLSYGDIVGVVGGKISKNYATAEKFMVVSAAPAVIGNMPQPAEEHEFETVAFVGQVPVKVKGEVHIGDYILPSGDNDGFGTSRS